MNDDLIILDGCTFVYSDGSGDVEAEEAEGFFYQDVRHLSRWLLRIKQLANGVPSLRTANELRLKGMIALNRRLGLRPP